ncbi:MAG: PBP1A family penicillin-binding protein [Clostridia bacterium]|nr:PBP1A family penicillin-binding protein [Clostridia bacterium]
MRREEKKLDKFREREDKKLLIRYEGKKKRHFLRNFLLIFSALVILSLVAGYYIFDVPSWQKLDLERITSVAQTGAVYDRNDEVVSVLKGSEDRTLIRLSEVPDHVKNAFIAAEDLRFYKHPGFDIVRIFGAVMANLRSGGFSEGASTITQQLVKLTHLSSEKTIARKLEEVYLALQLEAQCTKDEILEMYLNYVYFGRGAYGIEAAARTYFGATAATLTPAQAATLAAVIKAPSAYAPHLNAENNASRRRYILDTMLENGLLSPEDHAAAIAEEIVIIPQPVRENTYGWYMDAVMDEAAQLLGISGDQLLGSGYRIYTALDPAYQAIADKQFQSASVFPENASDGEKAQSAMACIDTESGAVRCVVGGREYSVQRGLNRATQMRRQPGSALKPLAVFAPAIENYGATAATVLNDTPTTFAGGYAPRNAGYNYHGYVTVREALKWSMNVAAVSMLDQIGVGAGRAYLEKVGIPLTDSDWGLSLALGSLTYGVSPVQLAAAYVPFANGGTYYTPYFIRRIEDAQGNVLYRHFSRGQRVLSEETAYLMTSLLQSVTSSGTGAKLSAAGTPVAGKTGTVNMENGGNRDIWMAAYNAEISTAFWMGFDNPDQNHRLASWVSGGDYTAALAASFFKSAYSGKSKPAFRTVDNIVWQTVDRASVELLGEAMLATDLTPDSYKYSEVFIKTNKLSKRSTAWKPPASPKAFYITHNESGAPVLCITPAENALLRIQRDSAGESIVLTELNATAGQTLYYADTAARAGTVYTYRVIPVHRELLQNGILLEGTQSVQIAQARTPAAGIGLWDSIKDFFSAVPDESKSADALSFDAQTK